MIAVLETYKVLKPYRFCSLTEVDSPGIRQIGQACIEN